MIEMDWKEELRKKIYAGAKFIVIETPDRYRIKQVRDILEEIARRRSSYERSFRESTSMYGGDLEIQRDAVINFYHGLYTHRDDAMSDLFRIVYDEDCDTTIVVLVPDRNILPTEIVKGSVIIVPPISTPTERHKAMVSLIEEYGKKTNITDEMIRMSKGLTLEELSLAVRESFLEKGTIDVSVFRDYKIQQLRKYGLEYVEPEINFEHVGGNKELKDYVRKHVITYFKHPDVADKFGLKAPRGMLMAGIGGTGKTWFATALAGELAMPVVKMDVTTFLASGHGEVEMKRVLRIVNALSPLVVFIDEIDQIAMKREEVKDPQKRGMINVLMEWLGNAKKEAFVVGATNLIQQIDENFLRTGRFDLIIYIPPPDREEREEILNIHAFKVRQLKDVKLNPEILSAVAEKTELWVGSDLENLVQKAFEYAMLDYVESGKAEVTMEHFEKAMGNVMPNMELRTASLKETIKGMKMLPQGAVMKDTLEKAELMVNIGKRRKYEARQKR